MNLFQMRKTLEQTLIYNGFFNNRDTQQAYYVHRGQRHLVEGH